MKGQNKYTEAKIKYANILLVTWMVTILMLCIKVSEFEESFELQQY